MALEAPEKSTVDVDEIAKFTAMANEWWDPDGKFKPLHALNPARLAFIRNQVCGKFDRDARARRPLEGLRLLDIGCGGGLISEPMTRLGAKVVGADMAPLNVQVAKAHAAEQNLEIDYRRSSAEELASQGELFDVVLALEILEHVADIDLFLSSCCKMVAPGGLLILSTINRTRKAYAVAIIGAEYLIRWVPKGTHDFEKFVKPEEIESYIDASRFIVDKPVGLSFNPLQDRWHLTTDVSVNYMMAIHDIS